MVLGLCENLGAREHGRDVLNLGENQAVVSFYSHLMTQLKLKLPPGLQAPRRPYVCEMSKGVLGWGQVAPYTLPEAQAAGKP